MSRPRHPRARGSRGSTSTPYVVAAVALAVVALGFAIGGIAISGASDARDDSITDALDDTSASIASGIAEIDAAVRRFGDGSNLDTTDVLGAVQAADEALTELSVPQPGVAGPEAAAIARAVEAHQGFLRALAQFAVQPETASDEGGATVVTALDALLAAVDDLPGEPVRPDQESSLRTFPATLVARAAAAADADAADAEAFRAALAVAAAIEADRDETLASVAFALDALATLRDTWPPLDEPFTTDGIDAVVTAHDAAIGAVSAEVDLLAGLDVDPAFSSSHTVLVTEVTRLRNTMIDARDTLVTEACDTAPSSTTTTTTTEPDDDDDDDEQPNATIIVVPPPSSTTTTTEPCPDLGDVDEWTGVRAELDRVSRDIDSALAVWQDDYEDAVEKVFR